MENRQQKNLSSKSTSLSGKNVAYAATMIYLPMLIIGVSISWYFHPQTFFGLGQSPVDISKSLAAVALGAAVLLIGSHIAEELFPSFAGTKRSVAELMAQNNVLTVVYLAVISGFAEEALFRVAMQPWIGVFFASIIFASLHLGPGGQINAWTVWAWLSGLLLGWLFVATGSALVPAFTHTLVNLISLLWMRYKYYRTLKLSAAQQQPNTVSDAKNTNKLPN